MEMNGCRRVSTTATVEHACPEQVGKSHMLPTLRLFGYTNTRRIHPPSREERVFRPHRSEPSDEQAGDEADLL